VGQRIRRARQERGMSLAQLGGAELTRGFISAVELGRSRISLKSLSLIAQRLQLPMSYFLEDETETSEAAGELSLDRAEIALRSQQPAEALRLLDEMGEHPSLRARNQWLRGWALSDLGRSREAVPVLEEALQAAQGGKDPRLVMQIQYTLGMALFAASNYDEALVYMRQAHEYASEEGDDALLGRITVCIGHIEYMRGSFDGAFAQYARARELFDKVNDFDNLASVYSGLSRVQQHRGDLHSAIRYSRLSLGIHQAKHNEREAARELSQMATRYEEMGNLDQALETARNAVARAQQSRARDMEALARTSLASVYLRLEDVTRATEEAEAAQRLAPNGTDIGHIEAEVVLAKIAARGNDQGRIDTLFQSALEDLSRSGFSTRYADVALEYSQVLQDRGDTAGALRYARQAALAFSRRA
jgi:tetratricopeptide (TPR) repeat protein